MIPKLLAGKGVYHDGPSAYADLTNVDTHPFHDPVARVYADTAGNAEKLAHAVAHAVNSHAQTAAERDTLRVLIADALEAMTAPDGYVIDRANTPLVERIRAALSGTAPSEAERLRAENEALRRALKNIGTALAPYGAGPSDLAVIARTFKPEIAALTTAKQGGANA